jgi:hypothetical protein
MWRRSTRLGRRGAFCQYLPKSNNCHWGVAFWPRMGDSTVATTLGTGPLSVRNQARRDLQRLAQIVPHPQLQLCRPQDRLSSPRIRSCGLGSGSVRFRPGLHGPGEVPALGKRAPRAVDLFEDASTRDLIGVKVFASEVTYASDCSVASFGEMDAIVLFSPPCGLWMVWYCLPTWRSPA